MRNAIIDIGSNSIKMRIYDSFDLYHPLYFMNVTRLAKGLVKTGRLNDESIKNSLNTIIEFKNIADERKAETIHIFATQALREASNSKDFLFCVKEKTGLGIDIIDGSTEAMIGFLGASNEISGDITLIDIGGASTEIVSREDKTSYPIGAVKLKESDINLKALFEDVKINGTFVGIGGTITTIAAIRDKVDYYTREKIQGSVLSLEEIKEINSRLLSMSLEDRKNVVGLNPKRADIICYGIEILIFVMENNNIGEITVSDFGSMEGYMKYKGLL